jgi:predicted RNA binding protein YcfA (HicA-like mRNA interferase family)
MQRDSKKIIKTLKMEGWELVRTSGSHHHFQHPHQKGTVTVPHPNKNIHPKTVKSIERQSGVTFS